MEITFTAKKIPDLDMIAQNILKFCMNNKVFALYGDMGVGKTTLIKKLCSLLGIKETTNSPTFAIANEYKNGNTIYHLDFYRLKNEKEAFDIGYEEYVYSGHYCFIEWPAIIEHLLPKKIVKILIMLDENKSRIITVKK